MILLQELIAIKIKVNEEKKTTSGVLLPKDKWGERQDIATVTQLHDGYKGLIKVGDEVLINPYAVHNTPDPEIKLIMVKDVLGIWQFQ